jgi:hypothetical protein
MVQVRQTEGLTVAPAEWSASIAAHLSKAETTEALDDLRIQVERGDASAFVVRRGCVDVGAYVLRIDETPSGFDGVVLSGAGSDDIDLTAALFPFIEQQFRGVQGIRVPTLRPGLVKKLRSMGYQTAAIVMRKGLR